MEPGVESTKRDVHVYSTNFKHVSITLDCNNFPHLTNRSRNKNKCHFRQNIQHIFIDNIAIIPSLQCENDLFLKLMHKSCPLFTYQNIYDYIFQIFDIVFPNKCFLGQNTRPATWPDANRIMEYILLKLCEMTPRHKMVKGQRYPRWGLIIQAYKRICSTVINNAKNDDQKQTEVKTKKTASTSKLEPKKNTVKPVAAQASKSISKASSQTYSTPSVAPKTLPASTQSGRGLFGTKKCFMQQKCCMFTH